MAVDRQTVDLSLIPRPRRVLPRHSRAASARDAALAWAGAPDPEVVQGAAGWPATARGFHLVADPAARRDAPVLARPRQPGALEPLGAAQAVVAAVSEGLRRNRPLARDLLHGRRHRSDLRRYEPTDRPGPLCPGAASARSN